MRTLIFATALLCPLALAACSSGSETRGAPSEVGSSATGGFVRGGDTYGTNRRVDVYGGSTAPSLPTIGAPGFGK